MYIYIYIYCMYIYIYIYICAPLAVGALPRAGVPAPGVPPAVLLVVLQPDLVDVLVDEFASFYCHCVYCVCCVFVIDCVYVYEL